MRQPYRPARPFYDMLEAQPALARQFWSRVRRGADDACWPWMRANGREASDYGRFHVLDRTLNSNRVAWALANQEDPGERLIRHSCDNPACCNPAHLEPGTHADNAQDKVSRNRWRGGNQRGERNPRARLKAHQIADIVRRFRDGERMKDIAAHYPVSRSMIDRIYDAKAWLPEAAAAGWEPARAALTARLPRAEAAS